MKKIYIIGAIAIFLLIGGSWWSHSLQAQDPSVMAENGLHWHAMLSIVIGTTTVTIPEGIGLGATEMPIHTHDDTGKIHMEFPGVVYASDLELKHVFEEWGRPMNSFGTDMTMTVNGASSTAYGDYVMRDGDTIVLRYK